MPPRAKPANNRDTFAVPNLPGTAGLRTRLWERGAPHPPPGTRGSAPALPLKMRVRSLAFPEKSGAQSPALTFWKQMTMRAVPCVSLFGCLDCIPDLGVKGIGSAEVFENLCLGENFGGRDDGWV